MFNEESTEVIEDRVRPVQGFRARYVVPVVVQDSVMSQGPWAKQRALEYATRVLRLNDPTIVATAGTPSRNYTAYTAGKRTTSTVGPQERGGAVDVDTYKKIAMEDSMARGAAKGVKDPRVVVEVTVEGLS